MTGGVRVTGYEFLGWVAGIDEVPVGTCFQVSPGVLVTAFHVLVDIGVGAVGGVVRIGPVGGGRACDATVLRVDKVHDVAVLRAERPLPRSSSYLVRSDQVQENEAVTTAGCPAVDDDDHEYALVPSGGHWRGPMVRDSVLWARLQADAVLPGMSGAPVLRVSDRAVVGVVSGRYNSRDGWLTGAVWVSRVEDLIPVLAGIAPLNVQEAAPTIRQRLLSSLMRWNVHRAVPALPKQGNAGWIPGVVGITRPDPAVLMWVRPYRWPVLAVVGVMGIVWLPRRWEQGWLDGVPANVLFGFNAISLLAGLCLMILGRRLAGACGLLVFLAGLFVVPPAPVDDIVQCGNATVIVTESMTTWATAELTRLVSDSSPASDPAHCAKGLEVVGDDGDVGARLRTTGAPVGGIVTSDPDAVRNLDPAQAKREKWPPNLPGPGGYVAEPVDKWVSIGRDVASAFLPSRRGTEPVETLPFGRAVPMAGLPALSYQETGRTDAVASVVAEARKGAGLSELTAGAEAFVAGEPCPTGVVLAGSRVAPPPCDAAGLTRATIVGADGRALGVPVLGVPFDSAGPTGPGAPARAAVRAFFDHLRRAAPETPARRMPTPAEALPDLVELTAEGDEVRKEITDLPPLVVRRPTHWIAVVDASLSTGRAEGGGRRASVPPLDAALAGLAAFTAGPSPQPGDRLSILTAQAGRAAGRKPVEWSAPAASPPTVSGVVARGETGLPVFLTKAEKLREQADPPNKRVVRILMTDGVNVFTEQNTARPAGLAVLVIGNSRGCAAVPARWSANCHRAQSSADDVAAQLSTISASPGR